MTRENPSSTATLDDAMRQALAFQAPYVIDRLIKDHVADTHEHAGQLFTEAKKYLVLCKLTPEVTLDMYSVMVDHAWHTFILFTQEYADYGHRFFGHYLEHCPTIGQPRDLDAPQHGSTFDDFKHHYETLYRQPLPKVWYDIESITLNRRVRLNEKIGPLVVTRHDDTVELCDQAGWRMLSVNDLAYPALDFLTRTPIFYVRELPGDLTDEEKLGLAQALARTHVLRVTA
ncbi:MAG: hypothetical protein K2Q25_12690 [Mycobacteriaceae bacterium]|nr:hypothetical protein [Mycobacteriaceae bacterium]